MYTSIVVADPGFPVGGRRLEGDANSQGGYISKILYVEMKESGPIGGRVPACPLDMPMTY